MAYIGRSISGDPALVVREQNKEERRSRILGAAEKLIRELGTVEFSMRELAARAHISHYTSYNLIGNKGTVLYTLLHRAIDRITNLPSQADPNFDPLSYAFDMGDLRSEEHTSELQSLMRNSYAVFCLKKKNKKTQNTTITVHKHTYPL